MTYSLSTTITAIHCLCACTEILCGDARKDGNYKKICFLQHKISWCQIQTWSKQELPPVMTVAGYTLPPDRILVPGIYIS